MQVDDFMAQPVGLAGDAMLATVVNHVASREGPVEAAELEMIYGMIAALKDRVSPQALMIANAKLAAIRTAQEVELAQMEAGPAMALAEPPRAAPEVPAPEIPVPEIPTSEIPDASIMTPDAAASAEAEIIAWPGARHEADADQPHRRSETGPAGDVRDSLEQGLDIGWQEIPDQEIPDQDMPDQDMPDQDIAWRDLSESAQAHEEALHCDPAAITSLSPETLAATCPPRMLLELARLPAPSDRLCNLIVARGHAEALVAILGNPAARFAKSSLTTMVELAASDMSLREAMCARADLSDMILDRLWPYLSSASKARALAAGCEASLAEARLICADAATEEADELAGDDALKSVAQWREEVISGGCSLSHALRALDQDGRIVDVAALLGGFAGLGQAEALALMIGAYDRGAVALARLAGCDEEALMSLIHLRGRAGARSTADKRGPVHAFLNLSQDEARDILARCFAAESYEVGQAARVAA